MHPEGGSRSYDGVPLPLGYIHDDFVRPVYEPDALSKFHTDSLTVEMWKSLMDHPEQCTPLKIREAADFFRKDLRSIRGAVTGFSNSFVDPNTNHRYTISQTTSLYDKKIVLGVGIEMDGVFLEDGHFLIPSEITKARKEMVEFNRLEGRLEEIANSHFFVQPHHTIGIDKTVFDSYDLSLGRGTAYFYSPINIRQAGRFIAGATDILIHDFADHDERNTLLLNGPYQGKMNDKNTYSYTIDPKDPVTISNQGPDSMPIRFSAEFKPFSGDNLREFLAALGRSKSVIKE